jgi:hypothetical protein
MPSRSSPRSAERGRALRVQEAPLRAHWPRLTDCNFAAAAFSSSIGSAAWPCDGSATPVRLCVQRPSFCELRCVNGTKLMP